MKTTKSAVVVTPDIAEMEALFGLKSGLFWTVKLLKENNPLLVKELTTNSNHLEKFMKPFIIQGLKFTIQDYHNLYYISLRMRTDRNLSDKVIESSGFRTKADKKMKNMVIDEQGDSWVTLRESNGHAGNYEGSRYRLFRSWIKLLTPWLAMRHGLKKKNECRVVIVLLLINSGFEEFEVLFEEWKQHPEHLKKIFQPSVSPLDREFISMLDRRLRQQVKKTTKAVNPRTKELQDFLETIKRCSSLPIAINKIPRQVAQILDETHIKSKRFTSEDIEYVLYRLRIQNKKRDLKQVGVWPEKCELPKNHPKIKLFKARYEKQQEKTKPKKTKRDTNAEEKLKSGKLYLGKDE